LLALERYQIKPNRPDTVHRLSLYRIDMTLYYVDAGDACLTHPHMPDPPLPHKLT